MAKDPAVLFYTSDFLSGTYTMTDAQVGKYIRLLCLQHQKGMLYEKDMINICKEFDEEIFSKFTKEGNIFFNQRMKDESERRKKFSESRSNNRKSKTHAKHMNNTSKSYDKHMETETENITETISSSFGKFENLLNEMEIGATIEFISITGNRTLTEKDVEDYFKAFLIHSEGKFYSNRSDKLQHFRSWLKGQKENYGSHKQTSKSTGAEQLLDSLKADIAAGAGNYQG